MAGRRLADQSPVPRPEPDERTRNIVRGIGSLSIQGVVSALLGFVLLGSLLRLLPSLEYGYYSSLQVSVSIASYVAVFGLSYSVVKFLAPGATAESGAGWGVAKATVVLAVSFSSVVSLVLIVAAPSLAAFFLKDASLAWVFYLGSLWLFTYSVSTVFQGVLQGMRRYRLLAETLVGSRFVAVAVAAAGLVLFRSLTIAILSWAFYGGITVALVLIVAGRPLLKATAAPHFRRVLKYAAPLGVAGVVTGVAANADIVVVGGVLNPISLGVYNATVLVSSVISSLFVYPLVTALFAETSFSSETAAAVSRGTTLALRFGTLTVLPASLFAAAVASQLFDLFSGGGTYTQGIPFLQIIVVFYIFYAVQAISIYVLQGVGKTKQVLIIGVITALGELGMSISLVPSLGLAGAAYSRVTIMVVGAAISLYFMRGYLKGATSLNFLSKALLSSAVPAAVVFALSTLVSNRILTLLPYTVLGVLLYLGCARAFKLLSDEDRSFVAHLLPEKVQWIVRML
jgi:O-antigen/teichoic acid export membrane protein